jgi:hypothetical protein
VKKGPLQLPRTYIAGPMTGLEEHNFPAFEKAAAFLRQNGHVVISPRELEAAETGPRKSWEYYLRRDLKELITCDHIAVLPGWHLSPGASLEVYVGWRLGFSIISAETMDVVDVSWYDFSKIQKETNSQAFVRAFTPPKMGRDVPELYTNGVLDFEEDPTNYKKVINKSSENILEEANRLVHGDRGKAYGRPIEDFGRTARIWSAILGFEVPVEKVALCMVGVKISRQCNAPKRDNFTDMAGYAETGYMVEQDLGRME